MTPLSIRRLSTSSISDEPGDRQRKAATPFYDVLYRIYFASEFIDPLEDIVQALQKPTTTPPPIPFGVMWDRRAVGFLVIDFSGPSRRLNGLYPRTCWLESFFIAREEQGKGYAKAVLKQLPGILTKRVPEIRHLNLTVNFRNQKAKGLYLKSGFQDTGEVYRGGPAGPQHVLTKSL